MNGVHLTSYYIKEEFKIVCYKQRHIFEMSNDLFSKKLQTAQAKEINMYFVSNVSVQL